MLVSCASNTRVRAEEAPDGYVYAAVHRWGYADVCDNSHDCKHRFVLHPYIIFL